MSPGDATQVMPVPTWTDPRIHLLDDTWLLTIFAILLATVVPWLVSALDINFVAACLGLLALGAIHICFTLIGKPARCSATLNPSAPSRAHRGMNRSPEQSPSQR